MGRGYLSPGRYASGHAYAGGATTAGNFGRAGARRMFYRLQGAILSLCDAAAGPQVTAVRGGSASSLVARINSLCKNSMHGHPGGLLKRERRRRRLHRMRPQRQRRSTFTRLPRSKPPRCFVSKIKGRGKIRCRRWNACGNEIPRRVGMRSARCWMVCGSGNKVLVRIDCYLSAHASGCVGFAHIWSNRRDHLHGRIGA